MPLIRDPNTRPVTHDSRRCVGFWMLDAHKSPSQPVRILVTYEALAQLDPNDVRDLHAAFEHLDRFQPQIELAASQKYDRGDVEAERHEGQPVIMLRSSDF